MSDLYERLLAKVAEIRDAPPPCTCGECPDDTAVVAAAEALVASLELHKPRPCYRPCSLRHEHVMCAECGGIKHPPCPTVRAVARALDVEIGDHR